MKMYNKYKASNTKWVDEIPFEWKIVNFRYLINVLTDFTANGSFGDLAKNVTYLDSGFSRLIRQTDLNGKFKNKAIYVDELAHNYLSKSELFGGEVILANVGSAGLSWIFDGYDGKATLGPNCFLLKFNQLFNNKFAYISLNSYYLNSQILDKASSSIQPKLNKEDIRTCKVIVPSVQEQIKITEYIEYKTNLIDTTIEKKKRLIELLKEKRQAVINEAVTKGLNPNVAMKDSGLEWLGEIPAHWEVVRLKKIADAFGRIGYRGYTTQDIVGQDEGAITISPSNMKGNYMTFENCTYINWYKYEESPEIKIYNDDILMVKTGSTYGKVGIVRDLDKKATINPQLLVLKNVRINSTYLFNLLRTNYIQYQVETNVIGSTIPTISQTKILNFSLPLPPNEEIEFIMQFIQNQMNLIDKTQKAIEIAIKKLQTYRQSLISEAVTGKMDVRDWQPPKK